MALSRAVNAATAGFYQHGATGPWQVIAGSKRRSLLMAGDDDMFMIRTLNVTPKTAEQHLIVHSDKSVAYVTNNKRSTFCTTEANHTLLTVTKHRTVCTASLRRQSYWLVWTTVQTINCSSM